MSIVVDARSAGTLYATSWTLNSHGGGVYRSADAGHNWELIGLEGHAVRALAAAPSNPNILDCRRHRWRLLVADSGKNWERISPENHADLRNFDSIAIDPHDPTQFTPARITCRGKPWTAEKAGRRFHQGMVDDSERHDHHGRSE